MGNYRKTYFDNTMSVGGLYYCKRCHKLFRKEQMDVDHIVPQSKGGSDALWNLQGLCQHCNRSKGAKTDNTVKDLVTTNATRAVTGLVKGVFGKRR